MACILVWSCMLYRKFFLRKEFKPEKPERELTTVEVNAWFFYYQRIAKQHGFYDSNVDYNFSN
jgi:hypothetical protein